MSINLRRQFKVVNVDFLHTKISTIIKQLKLTTICPYKNLMVYDIDLEINYALPLNHCNFILKDRSTNCHEDYKACDHCVLCHHTDDFYTLMNYLHKKIKE